MSDTPAPRYGLLTRAVHWIAAVLVIAAFALGLSTDLWPRGAPRDLALTVHYSLGTLVLALLLVRVLRRLLARPLPDLPGTSRVAAWAATGIHWALYAAMVALPCTGALDRWARGRPLSPFGLDLPPPFPVPGGRIWEQVHELIAYALIALALAHAAAALWHHFVLRDSILQRMLPSAAPRFREN